MDSLPQPLLLEILTRLRDSADVARCRLVSKTLNAVSREVRSVHLRCTLSRYLKSRSPETKSQITPFKTIFNNLVRNSHGLDSVSIGVEKSLGGMSYDDVEDESVELYLTDLVFVKEWLPKVCGELRSLSISDFWIQSCWRKSGILALISSCCHRLVELEVKNAWLSVDGLNPMPMLTNLTLEFVRLDDEYLNKVNHCFPSLKVLNLIGVGGLKEPKIHLSHLRSCRWTISNAPDSLTMSAPNLVKFELKCIKPRSLVLETPLLSDFYLSLEKAYKFEVLKKLLNLKRLRLESANLCSLIRSFPHGILIERLTVDSLKCTGPVAVTMLSLEALFDVFPNVRSVSLRSGAWSETETCFLAGGLQSWVGMTGLKEIVAQLVIHDVGVTLSFIFCILDKCTNLSDMALLIHCEVDPSVTSILISRCTTDRPRVRWKWGMWKEDIEDIWISEGI